MTQKDQILQHLMDGKSITNLEAIDQYGITRVSDIINKLRKEGYPILTETDRSLNRYGKEVSYGRYKMCLEQVPCGQG